VRGQSYDNNFVRSIDIEKVVLKSTQHPFPQISGYWGPYLGKLPNSADGFVDMVDIFVAETRRLTVKVGDVFLKLGVSFVKKSE
jgi:hypothetical protein